MARARFTAALIDDLKGRVAEHVRWAAQAPGRPLTKLADLMAIYERHHRGAQPHVRALGKIDARLGELRKAAGDNFDETKHQRDADGRFTDGAAAGPAVPVTPLPQARNAHQQMQQTNAGYDAITSTALPTKFWETAGAITRTVGVTAGGIAIATSLARQRIKDGPQGFVHNAAARAGEAAGKIAGVMIAAGPVQAARATNTLIRRVVANQRGLTATPINPEAYRDVIETGARWGGAAGKAVGARGAAAMSWAMKHISGAAANSAATPRGRELRRIAAIATIGALIGSRINAGIQDTYADPAYWGRGIDPFDYRVVRKFADSAQSGKGLKRVLSHITSDQIDAMRAAATAILRKGGDYGDLRKAIRPIGLIGQGISAIGAALGGAAIGGAAAYGGMRLTANIGSGKRGNPYRDDQGRFSSRDRSRLVIGSGALLGALVGGAAALLAARRGNATQMVRAITRHLDTNFRERTDAVLSRSGVGKTKELIQGKAVFVEDLVQGGKGARGVGAIRDFQAAKVAHVQYGTSAPLAYKEAVRKDINDALVHRLAGADEFIVPAGKDAAGKTIFAPLREVRGAIISNTRKAPEAEKAVRSAVESYDTAQLTRAVAKLPTKMQDDVLRLHGARTDLIGQVDKQISTHLGAIDTAATMATQAAAKAKAAVDAVNAGRTRLGALAADAPERILAEGEMQAAQKIMTAAMKVQEKAETALNTLRSAGPAIKSPVTGQPIQTMTSIEAQAIVSTAELRARRAAEAIHERAVAHSRDTQIAGIADRRARLLAVAAVSGQRYGAPLRARRAQIGVLKAQRDLRVSEERVRAAELALSTARRKQKSPEILRLMRRGIKTREAKVAQNREARITAGAAYEAAIKGEAPPKHILPQAVRNALQDGMRDVKTIRGAAADTVRSFTERPTVARLIQATERMSRRTGNQVTGSLRATLRQALMENTAEGAVLSPYKILRAAPIFAGALGAAPAYASWLVGQAGGANTRRPAHYKLERGTDAGGAGFVGLSVPDPENRNDRIFVWGRKIDKQAGEPDQLIFGGRVSDVRNRLSQQGQNQQGQNQGGQANNQAPRMDDKVASQVKKAVDSAYEQKVVETVGPDFEGAPKVSYRKSADGGDADRRAAEGAYTGVVRGVMGTEEPAGGRLWSTLGALFAREGALLRRSRMAELITGYSGDGNLRRGVFRASENFKSNDVSVVAGQLSEEVGRIMRDSPPQNDVQRANLQRAAYIVGATKNIPADDMAIIHNLIRPQASAAGASASFTPPRPEAATQANDLPKGWKVYDLQTASEGHAVRVARAAGMHGKDDSASVATTIGMMARMVNAEHGLGLQDSVRVVADTMFASANAGAGIPKANPEDWGRALEFDLTRRAQAMLARARQAQKGWGLDGALIKSLPFNETAHSRRGKGSDRGGEFAPKRGGAVAERSVADPHRVGSELGSGAGQQASRMLMARYLPGGPESGRKLAASAGTNFGQGMKIARRLLPGAVGGIAGSVLGSEIGHQAVEAGYKALGAKSPGRYQSTAIDFGETAAELLGSILGSTAGGSAGAIGGPVGAFAGGAVGSLAGSEAGKQIYRYFAGYDPAAAARMGRHFKGLGA